MDKGIVQILDNCLDKVVLTARPGGTLEECLSEYKMVKMDLEPLLRAAMYTRENLVAIAPTPDFNERALTNLLNKASQMRAETAARARESKARPYLPGLGWIEALGNLFLRRRAWTMAMAGLLALLLAGGTVRASLNASPEQVLYPVKLSAEQVQLKLTADPEQKARLYMKFADRRVNEMALVAENAKPDDLDKLEEKLAANLGTAKVISEDLKNQPSKAENAQKLLDELIENASSNITTLRRSITVVPAGPGKRLEIVIDRTLMGYTAPVPKPGEPLKEEKPETQTPEGKVSPAGPDSGGRRWEIRRK